MRWSYGVIGVKDFFTLVNLTSGVLAVYFLSRGQFDHAGYSVILGYLLGDTLDGMVARATKTGNKFGGEFDSITDHFVHVFVPGLVLYAIYAQGGHATLGLVLTGILIGTATIRHALFAVEKFDFPLCWCGLPRTISGFAALSYPLSTLWFEHAMYRYWVGAGVIVVLSLLNLVPIPYMTHRGRKIQLHVKVLITVFFVAPPLAFLFARDFVFDIFFLFSFGYGLTGWIPILPDERKAFYAEYRRWAKAVAERK